MNPLEETRQQPCAVCGLEGPSEAHHIRSKGAGGPDTIENLMPLCRNHHGEWHDHGRWTFIEKYPHTAKKVKKALGLAVEPEDEAMEDPF